MGTNTLARGEEDRKKKKLLASSMQNPVGLPQATSRRSTAVPVWGDAHLHSQIETQEGKRQRDFIRELPKKGGLSIAKNEASLG